MTKLLLVLTGGLLLALAFIGYRNRHRFRYRPSTLSVDAYRRLAEGSSFRTDEAQAAPGVTLRGLVRRPEDPHAPWLFLLPGNGSELLSGGRALLQRLAAGHDCGLAVWAYRGFDGSTGTPDAVALRADSDLLWQRLQDEFGAVPERLHIVAFSLGTELALRLAAHLQARGTPPASLVLLSPYDRILVTADAWWAPWSFADEYDTTAFAQATRVDTMLVHGTEDDAVPIEAGRRLARTLGPRAALLELDGRGHADWLADDAVLAKVRSFLDAHWNDASPPPTDRR
ncbi:MAG: alpha/beta hydrolase [Planctomycetota bacterium]